MLTYSFDHKGKDTLYEYLYKQIKQDIITRKLVPGEKLPSKRALAKQLDISTITVENAYSQLAAEGYIYSVPKSGFYVAAMPEEGTAVRIMKNTLLQGQKQAGAAGQKEPRLQADERIRQEDKNDIFFADFVNNTTPSANFPFTTWTKLMRETMSENSQDIMMKSPSAGIYELRSAIADYLYQFRGMQVEPEQIVVGAGTEYLYGLIIQLLGRDRIYAVEDPGYQKISRIYQANSVSCSHVPLDEKGVSIAALEHSGADILHISPSHHFPTGLVTPVSRRYELLSWASQSDGRYIIEDDYDSEFRLLGKPIPALQSIDVSEKVIYINTFSKSLSSTIRISYMVLPDSLMQQYQRELSFYACTVSNFDQYTLARFIRDGYLEKHINRMRNFYRALRDAILTDLRQHAKYPCVHIREENAGLHFLLEVETELDDRELVKQAEKAGIHISCLSQYYYNQENADSHTFVINYSGIEAEHVKEAVGRLMDSI